MILIAATVFVSSMAVGQSVEQSSSSEKAPSVVPVKAAPSPKSGCCAGMAAKSCSPADKKACGDKGEATTGQNEKATNRQKRAAEAQPAK